MAHTRAWDDTTPPNSQAVSLGAQRIREFKVDVNERMSIDHVWDVDVNTDGYHNQLTMPVQGSDPAAVASAVMVYSKDVGAKAELHVRDEDGDIAQVTKLGVLAGSGERKHKTTNETVTSSITLQSDDDLTGFSVDAATYYDVEAVLIATSTSGTPGFKFAVVASQTVQYQRFHMSYYDSNDAGSGSGANGGGNCDASNPLSAGIGASAQLIIYLRGIVFTHATLAGTLELQWAQIVSDPTGVLLIDGTWMSVTPR